jgi:DNA-directed RNA polymerase specialized sigma24 family protein
MNPISTRFVATPIVATPAVATKAALPFVPLARAPRAANSSGAQPATPSANPKERAAAVERLYKEHYDGLLGMALLRVDHMADAKDALQEAVLILLSEPHRKVTRSVLSCIVRDVCRDQHAIRAGEESYLDDDYAEDIPGPATCLEETLRR